METAPLDAQAALDAAAAAELRSAQIATSTPWYAPWYGITCAGFPVMFALLATDKMALETAVTMATIAALLALMFTYEHVTGVWPSIRGNRRHVAGILAVLIGAPTLSCLVASAYGVSWWLLAVAVVTAILLALMSRSYDAALVRKHAAR